MYSRILGVACAVTVVGFLVACGAVQQASLRQRRANDLRQIGLALHAYHDTNTKLPANEAEFLGWARQMEPTVVGLVMSGQYTIVYAPVRLNDIQEGTSNVVLGYDNTLINNQRLVMTADGMVMPMNEAQFQGMPKLRAKK